MQDVVDYCVPGAYNTLREHNALLHFLSRAASIINI